MKKFWKSVNIWWSYGQELGVLFFWLTVYIHYSEWGCGGRRAWWTEYRTEKWFILILLRTVKLFRWTLCWKSIVENVSILSSLCQNAQHLYKCLAMANAMKYTFHCATASPSRCRHTPESIISSQDPLNYHPRVTGCFSQYSHAVMVIRHSTVACGTGYKEQRGDWKCETWICGTNLYGWKLREKLVWKAKVWKSVLM